MIYRIFVVQGIIADGEDGSHWVTVDDKGYGDCDGTIFYEYGDLGLGYCDRLAVDDGKQTRLFCGYASKFHLHQTLYQFFLLKPVTDT